MGTDLVFLSKLSNEERKNYYKKIDDNNDLLELDLFMKLISLFSKFPDEELVEVFSNPLDQNL